MRVLKAKPFIYFWAKEGASQGTCRFFRVAKSLLAREAGVLACPGLSESSMGLLGLQQPRDLAIGPDIVQLPCLR